MAYLAKVEYSKSLYRYVRKANDLVSYFGGICGAK